MWSQACYLPTAKRRVSARATNFMVEPWKRTLLLLSKYFFSNVYIAKNIVLTVSMLISMFSYFLSLLLASAFRMVLIQFCSPAGLHPYLSFASLKVRGRTDDAKVLYRAGTWPGTVRVELKPCPLTHQRFKG